MKKSIDWRKTKEGKFLIKQLKLIHCDVCCEESDYRDAGEHTCGGVTVTDAVDRLVKALQNE